jgi:hypothetical protein
LLKFVGIIILIIGAIVSTTWDFFGWGIRIALIVGLSFGALAAIGSTIKDPAKKPHL